MVGLGRLLCGGFGDVFGCWFRVRCAVFAWFGAVFWFLDVLRVVVGDVGRFLVFEFVWVWFVVWWLGFRLGLGRTVAWWVLACNLGGFGFGGLLVDGFRVVLVVGLVSVVGWLVLLRVIW